MREEKEPTVSKKAHGSDVIDVYEHDAYATITMTTSTGGGGSLFGSDLGHNQRIHISIQRAKLHRELSRDWIHGEINPLIDFEMSHSQFAQFITSNGNGGGTPVTLRYAAPRGTAFEAMPMIKNIETKHDIFRREIREMSDKRMEQLQEGVARLGALIDSGKAGKVALKEIHKHLQWAADGTAGSMEFVVKSAEEALEKATHDAKIEVEAYIDASARRIGLESISQLVMLENNKKE